MIPRKNIHPGSVWRPLLELATQFNRHRNRRIGLAMIAGMLLASCAAEPNPAFSDYNYNLPVLEPSVDIGALSGMSGGMAW